MHGYIRNSHNVVWLVRVMKQKDDFVNEVIDTWLVLCTADIQHPLVSCRISQFFLIVNQVPDNARIITLYTQMSGGRCRGSSATPFQFILITDCQPHPTIYRQ